MGREREGEERVEGEQWKREGWEMSGEKGREEGREWKEWEEVGMGKGGD